MADREAQSCVGSAGRWGVVERVRWHELDAGEVRSWWFSPSTGAPAKRTVVVFPGLGLPRYLLPLARTLAASGTEVALFDALAFRTRTRRRRVPPTIRGLASAGSQWIAGIAPSTPVVVLGHSTGSQVALEAVLALPPSVEVGALVMAGPTFVPHQRKLHRVVPAGLTAYRKETLGELVVLRDLAQVRTDMARIVRSGLRHRPEERVAALRVPLTVTAGEADSFAPAAWLEDLAERAGGPSRAVVLPGSHNNVFPHAREVAAVVVAAVDLGSGRC